MNIPTPDKDHLLVHLCMEESYDARIVLKPYPALFCRCCSYKAPVRFDFWIKKSKYEDLKSYEKIIWGHLDEELDLLERSESGSNVFSSVEHAHYCANIEKPHWKMYPKGLCSSRHYFKLDKSVEISPSQYELTALLNRGWI